MKSVTKQFVICITIICTGYVNNACSLELNTISLKADDVHIQKEGLQTTVEIGTINVGKIYNVELPVTNESNTDMLVDHLLESILITQNNET